MSERKPVKVSVVMQMDPMDAYADDLDALAHQFAGWIVKNVVSMTERMGGDLFVAVVTSSEGRRGSMSYRDGHFVKDETPTEPSGATCSFDANDREGPSVAEEPTFYRVGDPDPTAQVPHVLHCLASHASNWVRTRAFGHSDEHLAGDGLILVAVWDA